MGRIGRELVRLAEERVIALERALDSRDWHPHDPERGRLERRLAEDRAALADKREMLGKEEH